jgi:hypothetical protein
MRQAVLLIGTILMALNSAQAQWEIQDSHTTADLRGIHNAGGGVAWASGTNGTVLRTEDGGYLWQACSVPPGAEHLDFRGVQAFDANTAIVMSSGKGALSRLYKTTDGCHSWKLVFTNPDADGFWDSVAADGKSLMILGDPIGGSFVIESSEDGGLNWKRNEMPPSEPGEGAFAASNSALAIEWSDRLILAGTGGPHGARIFTECVHCTKTLDRDGWVVLPMEMFPKGPSSGIFSLAGNVAKAARQFVAVGGDYSKPESAGVAAYTSNLITWHSSKTAPHGYRSAVAHDEKNKTWIAVGPNGTDVSTDDGQDWRPLRPDVARHETTDADRNWNALSLPFVVGPHGRIGKLNEWALSKRF